MDNVAADQEVPSCEPPVDIAQYHWQENLRNEALIRSNNNNNNNNNNNSNTTTNNDNGNDDVIMITINIYIALIKSSSQRFKTHR